MFRRTRKNPTATVKDFTEGTIVPAAVTADIEARDVTVVDDGGGLGHLEFGDAEGSQFTWPANGWSGITGKPFVEADSGESAGDALTRINAALAAGDSLVYFRGDFEVNGPISIPSGVTLDATGATFSLVAGSYTNLLVNAAVLANARTVYAAMTSGSATLTAAGIDEEQPAVGPFDSGMVGEPVIVQGAGASGAPLVSTVASYTSATEITLDDNAGTTVSGQYATVGERDSDITVIGGTWTRLTGNNNWAYAHYLTHTMRFRHVDGLRIINPTFNNSEGKYAVAVGDCTSTLVDAPYLPFHNSDGVHVNGPAERIVIRAVQAESLHDDMVSLTAGDSKGTNYVRDVAGDITDVVIDTATVKTTTLYSSALKLIAGRTMDDSAHYHIRKVRASNLVAPTTYKPVVYLGDASDDDDADNFTEIIYDDIVIDGVTSLGGGANVPVHIHGGQIGTLAVYNLHCRPGDGAHVLVGDVGARSIVIDGLTGGAPGVYGVQLSGGADVVRMAIRRVRFDWDICDSASGSRVIQIGAADAIDDLIIEDVEMYASTGKSATVASMASGGALDRLTLRGIRASGAGSVYAANLYSVTAVNIDGYHGGAATNNLGWAFGSGVITLRTKAVTGTVTTSGEVYADFDNATNAQTGTTYTLASTDVGKLVTLSNGSAITLTVPANATRPFPVGTIIDLAQLGAGQVTIAPAGGVTINSTPGLKISAQYGGARLRKLATDTWIATGNLSA